MKTVVPRENPLRAKKRTNINPRWILLGVFGGVCRLVPRILTLYQTRPLKSRPILRPGRQEIMSSFLCLVPRPHYYAQPMRFGSRGPRKFLRRLPALRLGYVTEMHRPRGPGKTPYRDQANHFLHQNNNKKDFLKSMSNLHIPLSFLLICN